MLINETTTLKAYEVSKQQGFKHQVDDPNKQTNPTWEKTELPAKNFTAKLRPEVRLNKLTDRGKHTDLSIQGRAG